MTVKAPEKQPTSLHTFLIIWGGQLVSAIGSEMTNFAVAIWVWELTGKATPLSLIMFFTHTSTVIAACFAGVLVDRWNRKQLMIVGDAIAGLSTIAVLLLFLSNNLEIWHLYLTGAINGLFGYCQNLAYSASMSVIVPKQHYVRATAMMSIQFSSAIIIGPAFAGSLYPLIGLVGILIVDIITFIVAASTLWFVHIPQPTMTEIENSSGAKIWHEHELTFGFRYILGRPGLLAILIFLLSCNFVENAGIGVISPMILARTDNDAVILATVKAAFGVGISIGATVLTLWGGLKPHIYGMLFGNALTSSSMMVFGLGREPLIWIVGCVSCGLFSPWLGSSNQAIWLSKVEPGIQGKVFAARYIMSQITTPLALAVGGPLADNIFEPAMKAGGSLAGIFGGIFGTGAGAGMALQYTLFSFCGLLISIFGYAFHPLRNVEAILPDHD